MLSAPKKSAPKNKKQRSSHRSTLTVSRPLPSDAKPPCHPDHFEKFEQLAELVYRKSGGKKVIYHANPGNLGDAIIREGTLRFFDYFSIPYKEVFTKYLYSKRNCLIDGRFDQLRFNVASSRNLLVFGGGGGWMPQYRTDKAVLKLNQKFRNIIVLPSTIGTHFNLPNAIYVCLREQASLKFHSSDLRCHDMAFFCQPAKAQNSKKGVGNFFRLGSEANNAQRTPANNRDISLEGDTLGDTSILFDSLREHSCIRTDRLHVAVAAALLGKSVTLYPNSYFKNQAVFEFSMKETFPHVSFMQWQTPTK